MRKNATNPLLIGANRGILKKIVKLIINPNINAFKIPKKEIFRVNQKADSKSGKTSCKYCNMVINSGYSLR
ncbi:hypothetical protein GCM10007161_01670 [Ignatzschineria indica]|nr:hypothetical protein GCM10007161_01670 [Ignatzschineria indica]